jgi:hypothetical protein
MGIIAKIVAELGLKILTTKVCSEVLIYTLNYFAKKSEVKIDDQIVKTVADALGVKVD